MLNYQRRIKPLKADMYTVALQGSKSALALRRLVDALCSASRRVGTGVDLTT